VIAVGRRGHGARAGMLAGPTARDIAAGVVIAFVARRVTPPVATGALVGQNALRP